MSQDIAHSLFENILKRCSHCCWHQQIVTSVRREISLATWTKAAVAPCSTTLTQRLLTLGEMNAIEDRTILLTFQRAQDYRGDVFCLFPSHLRTFWACRVPVVKSSIKIGSWKERENSTYRLQFLISFWHSHLRVERQVMENAYNRVKIKVQLAIIN